MNTSNENPNAAETPRGTQPRFSILHTSARPNAWRAVYDAWLAAADRPEDVEYILVVDERWGFDFNSDGPAAFLRRGKDKVAWNTGRRCYVEGVNLAAKHATGDILIVVADDQFPCEHWDAELCNTNFPAQRTHGDVPFVLWAPTGTPSEFERGIIVMPIMSRSLYQRWGYVMYPGFESMYSDNDLCEHARADGVLIEAQHLPVFPHKHFLFTPGVEIDAAYKAQNRPEAYTKGEALLQLRRNMQFRDVPANPPTPIRSVGGNPAGGKKQTITVCVPGEQFSRPWVMNWTVLLAALSQKFELQPPIFHYASAPHVTRQAMRELICKGQIPDYVLWMDDDQLLKWQDLMTLHADLEEHKEADLVAGWAWESEESRGRAGLISAGRFNARGGCGRIEYTTLMDGPHDLFQVDWTGFPAVLMRGSLLVDAGEKAFIPIPNDIAPYWAYGEDISFCMRVKDHTLLLDRRVRVPHLKLQDNEPVDPFWTAERLKLNHEVVRAGVPA
jgi:hypothetical protein